MNIKGEELQLNYRINSLTSPAASSKRGDD